MAIVGGTRSTHLHVVYGDGRERGDGDGSLTLHAICALTDCSVGRKVLIHGRPIKLRDSLHPLTSE